MQSRWMDLKEVRRDLSYGPFRDSFSVWNKKPDG
jgi:hypothetical protein